MNFVNIIENEIVRVEADICENVRLFQCNKHYGKDVHVLIDFLPAGAVLAFDPKLTHVEMDVEFDTPEDMSFNVIAGECVLTHGTISEHGHMSVVLSNSAGAIIERVRRLVQSKHYDNDGSAIMLVRQAIDATPQTCNDRTYDGMYFTHSRACLTECLDTIICQYEVPVFEDSNDYVNLNTEFGRVVALRVGGHAYIKVQGNHLLQTKYVQEKCSSLHTMLDNTRYEFKDKINVCDNVVYLSGAKIGTIDNRTFVPADERCQRYGNLIRRMFFRD